MIFCRDFLKPPSPSQQDTNKLHFKSYAKTQQTIQEDINYYTIAVTFSLLFYPLPLTKPTNDKPMIIMPWEFFANNKNLNDIHPQAWVKILLWSLDIISEKDLTGRTDPKWFCYYLWKSNWTIIKETYFLFGIFVYMKQKQWSCPPGLLVNEKKEKWRKSNFWLIFRSQTKKSRTPR